jgi:RNA polymerase sigma-70 factor (ECF subfamily)
MAPWTQDDLEALYRRLEKPLYNVVYRLVWQREEARDLVQEAFVRLWAMRRRVEPETVEPLVYRIAVNLARSALRRRRVIGWLSLGALAREPREPRDFEGEIAGAREQTRLRRAIEALPDELRDVVLLTSFTELRYPDVARALGIAEGTVASRRHRALQLLREALGGEADERTA